MSGYRTTTVFSKQPMNRTFAKKTKPYYLDAVGASLGVMRQPELP